jgi:hypothetical protein
MCARTSAAKPPAFALELPSVVCSELASTDTSPPEPMIVFEPM